MLISVIGLYVFSHIMDRMHALAIAETIGICLICTGVAIIMPFKFIAKLIFLFLILLLVNPTATHILIQNILNAKDRENS